LRARVAKVVVNAWPATRGKGIQRDPTGIEQRANLTGRAIDPLDGLRYFPMPARFAISNLQQRRHEACDRDHQKHGAHTNERNRARLVASSEDRDTSSYEAHQAGKSERPTRFPRNGNQLSP